MRITSRHTPVFVTDRHDGLSSLRVLRVVRRLIVRASRATIWPLGGWNFPFIGLLQTRPFPQGNRIVLLCMTHGVFTPDLCIAR